MDGYIKRPDQITFDEWTTWFWIDITDRYHPEKLEFIRGRRLTSKERIAAIKEWKVPLPRRAAPNRLKGEG